MDPNYLHFEQPIAEMEAKIRELSLASEDEEVSVSKEIAKLREKSEKLTQSIYADLGPWEIVQVARHPQRPHSSDYLARIFGDFDELHGDRCYAEDASIIGGIASVEGRSVIVIAQEKGRNVKERMRRNFGMTKPEGYRKALRLMELAERFRLPVITFIDTPGAYPGVDAEERSISEAIARNLAAMSQLRTLILCLVIGEGSSGGALGIGIGDHLAMLEYSTYCVISPEGCANIAWKSVDKAPEAARAMGLTAETLHRLEVVNSILKEPLGGAHRNVEEMAERIKQHLCQQVDELGALPVEELLEKRYARLMHYGNV